MAKTAAPERVNLGNRLFRVGARSYIRVGVPRDLREALKAEGKSAWEISEPLKSTPAARGWRLRSHRTPSFAWVRPPSTLLRIREDDRRDLEYQALVADLRKAL